MENLHDIWWFVASMAGLGAIAFLRVLAIERRNQIQIHDCAREALRMRHHFEAQQKLRSMTRGAVIED